MWKMILSMIPWQVVIPWVIAKIADISTDVANKLINYAVMQVVKVEKQYGNTDGEEKAQIVKKQLKNTWHITQDWLLNLVNELAVAYAKKQGLIR